jgi:hypothetical protein
MFTIAITSAALLAAIVGLLAVPVVLVIDAERGETVNAQWHASWLFGLVRFHARSSRQTTSKLAPGGRQTRAPGSRKGGRRVGIAVWRTRGLVRRVVQLAITMCRRVTIERFCADVAFGFENPADTGFVYGCLSPLFMLASTHGLDLRCEPMFLGSGVTGVCGVTIRMRPLLVVGTVVSFLMSPPVIRALAAAWRVRT